MIEPDSVRDKKQPGTLQSRLFDHIDLRVRNRTRAQEFFAKILPAIGVTLDKSAEEWGAFEKDGGGRAETRGQVDRVAKIVREAGGQNLEGPQIWPEYSPGYYALFFEDPDGNKLEVCCRGSAIVAE